MNVSGDHLFIREIHSSIERVNEVDALLKQVNQAFEIPQGLQFKIHVALVEAVNNAMIHGNSLAINKTVIITCLRFPNYLRFSIKDEGSGFSFQRSFTDCLRKENIDKPNGRGIFIIQEFADQVKFVDRGRVVQIDFFCE